MYRPPHLTRREIEIVPFLVSGATRTEMAHHFNISEETINTHVRNLLRKFGAASLRDCIFDITQYNEQFIEGLHEFYVASVGNNSPIETQLYGLRYHLEL